MAKAKVAGVAPLVTTLAAGEYDWCACGQSQGQPFCDGSHAGTELEPVHFSLGTSKKVALCLCKQTATAPFCDGTHKRLPRDRVISDL